MNQFNPLDISIHDSKFCISNPIPNPRIMKLVLWECLELQSPVCGICQQLALTWVIGRDCLKLALSGLVNL